MTNPNRASEHRHRHKQRVIRGIPDDLCERFDNAAHTAGSDRSRITHDLWAWFAGDPGAQLPERPPAT